MKIFLRQRVNVSLLILALISVAVVALIAVVSLARSVDAADAKYELVSLNNTDGQGIDRNGQVSGLSGDGNKILFTSASTNLPSATADAQEWGSYIRDMKLGVTTRVDLTENGTAPNRHVSGAAMSTTGRYVVFSSTATNIVDSPSLDNSVARIYLRDLQQGTIQLITNVSGVTVNTSNGLSPASFRPQAVSDDGRYVTIFTNSINSLIPNTRSGISYTDLAMFDTKLSSWTLLNKPTDGIMQSRRAEVPSSSCDGSITVFSSTSTNLVSNYSGSGNHVYIADIRNGLNITDITPGGVGDSINASISCNGRYVVYATKDRTVVSPTPSGMSAYLQLVRYDRFTGEKKYISSGSNNTTFDGYQESSDLLSSVADTGDVVFAYGLNTSPYNRSVYLKHLSDNSGILESVQGPVRPLTYDPSSSPTYMISANGKYIAVSSRDGYTLGLLINQPNSYVSAIYDVIRIKTSV